MTFSGITRTLGHSSLATEILTKLKQYHCLGLNGAPRFPKGLVVSALAQAEGRNLLVVTATLEEASRWTAQLETMGWATVHFYPTTEASPYEVTQTDEMTWGQMQVLADLCQAPTQVAVVTTERGLQPHLPPVSVFHPYCLTLRAGETVDLAGLDRRLAQMGYERVPLVEMEGQWSRRGDIVDVFPVAAELPVRLEWFGDQLEQVREFDPATQRSLDKIQQVILTPTDFRHIIKGEHPEITDIEQQSLGALLGGVFQSKTEMNETPASLLDYLTENTIIAIDEAEQCVAHGDRWYEHIEEQWEEGINAPVKLHRQFRQSLAATETFDRIYLSEFVLETSTPAPDPWVTPYSLNLASRPLPVMPHQYAKLADTLRQEREKRFAIFLVSAQPSRTVSLLQEHDCPAQFIPNPQDYPAIDRYLIQHTPVAVKYTGIAELEGFILPTFRLVVATDREFYGQHSLATPSYVRKRRRAASKQVDANQLVPGDYVVHRQHGIGKFIKLESLTLDLQTREYLVIQYGDGTLRVAADQLGSLSRYRAAGEKKPQLSKLSGQAWENTKSKVRKSLKKLAVDLLELYAKRAQQVGYAFPPDMPWQQELEESFAYQPTPDQLKATQDVKRDMESDRPMDRLVCGDVGFGKTEVAVRAIFKAVTAGKQVAVLAPTTILTQQHYHTLKERFAPYPIEVGLLNRFRTDAEKQELQRRVATGEIDVLVGTQAILGKNTKFRDLGLLVVDEEQRFGVNQKEKIKAFKATVDVLTLTATPIPRTLYMSLSGIREMSLITTPPPSRRPIQTHLSPYSPEVVRTAIRQELDRGGQVFYVVSRIEGIEEIAAKLREVIPSLRIAVAHGQMNAAELEGVMLSFNGGEADLLLCTTIIESGLDIPRVNTILVEDAHRFGLAQLYQLRGRVGRAGIQAHAWLFYPVTADGREALTDEARKRLRAIKEFTQLGSGYQLALRDLEIRGAGDILGAEQSGQMNVIGFDLYAEMLEEAIREIKGQEIPQVDDTQIDLKLTAFIPAEYIPDLDQKMSAYRAVATATSRKELKQIQADWCDRYGPIPVGALQLLRVMELKQIAKKLGFSRIKPDGKQHITLETPMAEPAWNLLKENLPEHLQARFIYMPGKVTLRGLGVVKPDQQLENLIQWLSLMQGALPAPAIVSE